jgi:hypothetical protein
MDRMFMSRRLHRGLATLLTAALLSAGTWPDHRAQAALPTLSDEPAGDPGDGVLRPSDISRAGPVQSVTSQGSTTTTTIAASSNISVTATQPTGSGTWALVPCLNPGGQPWLTFRLVRIDPSAGSFTRVDARPASPGGRWHRAP